jgi:hypothetical protein
MKAGEIISIADSLKQNDVCEDAKFNWLCEANARVLCEIGKMAAADVPKITCGDDELSVPAPYSKMYTEYLLAMLSFVKGDYESYNAMYVEYEKTFLEYAKYCIRNR